MRLKIQYRIGFPQPHLSHTILISISISISISMIGPQCKCIHCLQYYLTDIQYFQGKTYPLHLQILSDRHAANNTQKGCMEDNVHYNTRNYSYLMYAFLPTLSVFTLRLFFPQTSGVSLTCPPQQTSVIRFIYLLLSFPSCDATSKPPKIPQTRLWLVQSSTRRSRPL